MPQNADMISVGTAPAGGAFFVVGSAIAEVVAGNAPETGWQVTAEATKGIARRTSAALRVVNSNSHLPTPQSPILQCAAKAHGKPNTPSVAL